ncbi:hypothetical protein ACFPRC_36585 [Streptomyces lienomycini]|uniref:Uncharacterized protein n=2 Tax=Streptomyces lienomycini TaxID=284035 RepID=A0ABV9X5I5_9ACTN
MWGSALPHSAVLAPAAEDRIWRTTDANEDLEPNASAPIMRRQNVVHLTKVITDWHRRAPATTGRAG